MLGTRHHKSAGRRVLQGPILVMGGEPKRPMTPTAERGVTISQQLDATGVICLYYEDNENVENDNEDNDDENNDNKDNDIKDNKDNDNYNAENATDANGRVCCDNSWTQPASFYSMRKKGRKIRKIVQLTQIRGDLTQCAF